MPIRMSNKPPLRPLRLCVLCDASSSVQPGAAFKAVRNLFLVAGLLLCLVLAAIRLPGYLASF